jgi:MFS transporter, DHA1 family, inner membrane transport protein
MADRGGTGAAWLPAAILGANLLQAALLGGLADGSGFGLPLQALAVLLSAGALFALSTVASARLAVLAPGVRGFVMACNGSAVFLGQAAGAAFGGAGIALLGAAGRRHRPARSRPCRPSG